MGSSGVFFIPFIDDTINMMIAKNPSCNIAIIITTPASPRSQPIIRRFYPQSMALNSQIVMGFVAITDSARQDHTSLRPVCQSDLYNNDDGLRSASWSVDGSCRVAYA